MITKFCGKPPCATSEGIAFRHLLNLHGRILECCGWELLLEHEVAPEILMARLTEQLGHDYTVTMEPCSEWSAV